MTEVVEEAAAVKGIGTSMINRGEVINVMSDITNNMALNEPLTVKRVGRCQIQLQSTLTVLLP